MKPLDGQIRLSRYTSNVGPDNWSLTITDQNSGLIVFTCELTTAAFSDLMSTRGAPFEAGLLNQSPNVGKFCESCEYAVPGLNGVWTTRSALARKEIALSFLASQRDPDGWFVASISGLDADTPNHHRVANGRYRVAFARYVEKPAPPQPAVLPRATPKQRKSRAKAKPVSNVAKRAAR